ncbi:WD40/YVTN/BNR-like repeat-containing protein [Nonomuraea basaltis]|uniref:WD40/YVTN/BNR-like repeat-containing protein n=1 Tax=Nonomuraea basaltis TaxID=2495887 RepID=UPI00110C6C96|nr:sialidase family protein [Nonomuraea basaltis]TMR95777.1 exo-alpha-sialidase [Nonomuraea basaltis]
MRDSRLCAAAAALAILALVASACGQPQPSSAPEPDDPGIGHIHGLGVDPADGALYLAGHYGLFKVTSVETAQRVAGRIQDHMGFTVTGSGTFLASGHPGDPGAASPHMGLIRSSDAGRTWATVSEGGAADFHALQPAGGKLYAYDSQTGRVRASADEGKTWTPGAQEDVIDLAASAAEADRLYATTPGGFAAVDANRLLAATEDGTVHESRNGGGDFTVVFRPAAS